MPQQATTHLAQPRHLPPPNQRLDPQLDPPGQPTRINLHTRKTILQRRHLFQDVELDRVIARDGVRYQICDVIRDQAVDICDVWIFGGVREVFADDEPIIDCG